MNRRIATPRLENQVTSPSAKRPRLARHAARRLRRILRSTTRASLLGLMAVVAPLALVGGTLHAQRPLAATEGMTWASQLQSALSLPDSVAQRVWTVSLSHDACLTHWRAVKDSAQSAELPEARVLELVLLANRESEACREARRLATRSLLPTNTRAGFDQWCAQSRPNVLHFGIHNRLDCVVCKPEPPTP